MGYSAVILLTEDELFWLIDCHSETSNYLETTNISFGFFLFFSGKIMGTTGLFCALEENKNVAFISFSEEFFLFFIVSVNNYCFDPVLFYCWDVCKYIDLFNKPFLCSFKPDNVTNDRAA